jgi:hypothetical protein
LLLFFTDIFKVPGKGSRWDLICDGWYIREWAVQYNHSGFGTTFASITGGGATEELAGIWGSEIAGVEP